MLLRVNVAVDNLAMIRNPAQRVVWTLLVAFRHLWHRFARRRTLVGVDALVEFPDGYLLACYLSFSANPMLNGDTLDYDRFGVPHGDIFGYLPSLVGMLRRAWGRDEGGWRIIGATVLYASHVE